VKKILSAIGITLVVSLLIAVGVGGAAPPPGGPPPPGPATGDQGGMLPTGFFPYSGYHYSGYIVGINKADRTFSLYLGRLSNYERAASIETQPVQTDTSTIFYRRTANGPLQTEFLKFDDLRLFQLVGLAAAEKNGEVFLKIEIYGEPNQRASLFFGDEINVLPIAFFIFNNPAFFNLKPRFPD